MMLINYLQVQCLLPNFQDERNLVDKEQAALKLAGKIHHEKLTSDERKRLGARLNEDNLGMLDGGVVELPKTQEINTFIIREKDDRDYMI